MTLAQLIDQYKEIYVFLNQNWPLDSKMKRVFGKTIKLVEELGEMADDILSSMHLQRKSKVAKFKKENLEDEYADVLSSLILLGIELDIDIEKVIKRKITYTKKRFKMEK